SEHVLDKALVAGHIDDAEAKAGEIESGEADVDGDAARFFLGQTVAVDAGEGLDERRLAVVNMSSGAEDEIARHAVIIAGNEIARRSPFSVRGLLRTLSEDTGRQCGRQASMTWYPAS